MVQSQLSAYSGSDPIWGFVALVRAEAFTGEAAVGLDPRVRLFAVDGHIYFAERDDDDPIEAQLVSSGVVTAMQMARGVVSAGEQESLARLFQRDATIDRDAVELTVATATETLLAAVAAHPVGMPEVFPLRHHPAGLHHWFHDTTPSADDEPLAGGANDEPAWAAPIDASELPSISELVVLADVPTDPASVAVVPVLASAPTFEPPAPVPTMPIAAAPPPAIDIALPKLAAVPMSVKELKSELRKTAVIEPGTAASKNMAAVQIWEMVDEILDPRS